MRVLIRETLSLVSCDSPALAFIVLLMRDFEQRTHFDSVPPLLSAQLITLTSEFGPSPAEARLLPGLRVGPLLRQRRCFTCGRSRPRSLDYTCLHLPDYILTPQAHTHTLGLRSWMVL